MGHFSHNCKLTGVPITGGQPVVLIVMKMIDNLYDNSEEHLRKYGSCYMCSNESTRLKFSPVWFPIFGDYDDYGGIKNIIEDDNTKILEEYYGLTIDEIMGIVCSGRKDDGYDGGLKIIKKPIVIPEDWLENEDHFHYYQRTQNDPQPFDGKYPDSPGGKYRVYRDGKMVETTKEEYDADFKLIHDQYARYQKWKNENPDPIDDYGHPSYEEKYIDLLTYSGMWVHGKVYEELTKNKKVNDWYDSLELGTPALLNALGFVQGEKTDAERYNIPFTKDGLTVYSDGTWLHDEGNVGLYRLRDLKKYCATKGLTLDITELEGKDAIEQTYDYLLPLYSVPLTEKEKRQRIKEASSNPELLSSMFRGDILNFSDERDRMPRLFLNTSRYGRINNPLTTIYLRAAKEGKLRSNLVEFWRFDAYMYVCGEYYEIVGTGPQDGDHEMVMKVLQVATSVLNDVLKERSQWDDD